MCYFRGGQAAALAHDTVWNLSNTPFTLSQVNYQNNLAIVHTTDQHVNWGYSACQIMMSRPDYIIHF